MVGPAPLTPSKRSVSLAHPPHSSVGRPIWSQWMNKVGDQVECSWAQNMDTLCMMTFEYRQPFIHSFICSSRVNIHPSIHLETILSVFSHPSSNSLSSILQYSLIHPPILNIKYEISSIEYRIPSMKCPVSSI